MQTTGWPPGMLQDDSRELSRWLSTRLGARYQLQRNNMQTNQTPEALAEEIKRMAAEYYSTTGWDKGKLPTARERLHDAINRLRDMAASGAKDAEPVGVVETVRPASVVNAVGGYQTFEPRPEVRWGVRGMPPAGTALYAAIAATKRGGA